jgi:hypothetical protein
MWPPGYFNHNVISLNKTGNNDWIHLEQDNHPMFREKLITHRGFLL